MPIFLLFTWLRTLLMRKILRRQQPTATLFVAFLEADELTPASVRGVSRRQCEASAGVSASAVPVAGATCRLSCRRRFTSVINRFANRFAINKNENLLYVE